MDSHIQLIGESPRYSFRVTYPSPAVLTEAGYGRVAHIPFIQDSTLNYHVLGSRFLIDRGLAKWPLPQRAITSKSLKTFAYALSNYLEWCNARSVDSVTADYLELLINRYQHEMQSGIWSETGDALSATTINQRIDTAIAFQRWCADKNLRPPVVIPTKANVVKIASRHGSGKKQSKTTEVRKGRARVPKRRLGMPSEEAVGAWLNRIHAKPKVGPTEALLCETVLETALRKSEVAALRWDFLPADLASWPIVDRSADHDKQMVLVTLRYGTKGSEYGQDHGDKIGPEQTILMPMDLAMRLHHYRNKERPKAIVIACRKGKTATEQRSIRDESVHLFLNAVTGERYTPSGVYEAWRSVQLPQPGWTVHQGRDFWACTVLWKAMIRWRKLLEEAMNLTLDEATHTLLHNDVMSIIELQIKPQLRHANSETSLIYLQWLFDRVGVALDLHQNYVESIATEDSEDRLE